MVYLKQQMLDYLKAHDAGISYQTLLNYEKSGIVARPLSRWRMYTQEEVDIILEQVKSRIAQRKSSVSSIATPTSLPEL